MSAKRLLTILMVGVFFVVENANAFTLSPTKYLVTVAPGGSDVVEINIKNDDRVSETFGLSTVRVEQDEAGRSIINNSKDYPALSWVRPEKFDVAVAPGSSESIKYIIDIPKDAPVGSYYLGLAAYPLIAGDNKIGVNAQLVTVLYLKVAGVVNESLNVLSWKTGKISLDKKFDFFVELQNAGNMEVAFSGDASLKSWFGNEVRSEEIPKGSMLLSGETRNIKFVSAKDDFLMPGLYHADLKVLYGQSKQLAVESVSFWYLPWWSWLIVIIPVLIAAAFFIKKHSLK